ncbi:hypothetical protein CANCADRAFT_133750 [Tortispora caseinolytica NRRL Y-17796]|uniref:Secreted protein n=1 Tax=Tortispora caseinolytica NRRL Y-17796 TaxID=767744 RepID=A0A1E4TBG9_9ASCO|nr:hypothetical protein CANCADRAFT_133750 [Tortispora caseinolytica NRRL Y-17796]
MLILSLAFSLATPLLISSTRVFRPVNSKSILSFTILFSATSTSAADNHGLYYFEDSVSYIRTAYFAWKHPPFFIP